MKLNFNDATAVSGFLVPQAHRIEAEIAEVKYPSFDYAALVPVDTDGGLWDIGTVFYAGDVAGQAEFINGKASDMPYAEVSHEQFTRGFELVGIGYEWSRKEIEVAAMMGRDLGSAKARAARKVAESFLYGVAMSGNTSKGWTGLVNAAGVPAANAPTGTWGTATADQMVADMFAALNDVQSNTKETEIADALAIASSAYRQASAKRLGDTGETVISHVRRVYREAFGVDLTIRGLRDLETAGAGSTRRMVAYSKSPEALKLHLPGPHEFLEPYRKSSMVWEVAGVLNTGGLEVRLPKAISYRDGI